MKAAAHLLIAAAISIWLHGCGPPGLHAAQEAVSARLIDPESAQFRQLRVDANLVCGEVNARNRLGGYTGFEPFVISHGDVVLESDLRPIMRANEWASSGSPAEDVIGIARYHQILQSSWPSDSIAAASYERALNYCEFSRQWTDCQGESSLEELAEACDQIRSGTRTLFSAEPERR